MMTLGGRSSNINIPSTENTIYGDERSHGRELRETSIGNSSSDVGLGLEYTNCGRRETVVGDY